MFGKVCDTHKNDFHGILGENISIKGIYTHVILLFLQKNSKMKFKKYFKRNLLCFPMSLAEHIVFYQIFSQKVNMKKQMGCILGTIHLEETMCNRKEVTHTIKHKINLAYM